MTYGVTEAYWPNITRKHDQLTLARAQARYPGWDMTPCREAIRRHKKTSRRKTGAIAKRRRHLGRTPAGFRGPC